MMSCARSTSAAAAIAVVLIVGLQPRLLAVRIVSIFFLVTSDLYACLLNDYGYNGQM